MVDRYQASDRVQVAIANAVLKVVAYLSEINTKPTVCKKLNKDVKDKIMEKKEEEFLVKLTGFT